MSAIKFMTFNPVENFQPWCKISLDNDVFVENSDAGFHLPENCLIVSPLEIRWKASQT